MNKYQIGYTTGVFDLFHIGHLNLLRRAKELCDFLIVGVSTDKLVMCLKNKIAIIHFSERIQIIKSLRCVDKAVAEESTDKVTAWEKYKFNVVFKGDDWKGSDIWNKVEVDMKARGVEAIFFPYTKGTTSTKISLYLSKDTD